MKSNSNVPGLLNSEAIKKCGSYRPYLKVLEFEYVRKAAELWQKIREEILRQPEPDATYDLLMKIITETSVDTDTAWRIMKFLLETHNIEEITALYALQGVVGLDMMAGVQIIKGWRPVE